MDTEKTEPDVIAGARKTIKRDRPYILTEILEDEAGDKIANLLSDLDYIYYPIFSNQTGIYSSLFFKSI